MHSHHRKVHFLTNKYLWTENYSGPKTHFTEAAGQAGWSDPPRRLNGFFHCQLERRSRSTINIDGPFGFVKRMELCFFSKLERIFKQWCHLTYFKLFSNVSRKISENSAVFFEISGNRRLGKSSCSAYKLLKFWDKFIKIGESWTTVTNISEQLEK